jgi:hypothetical protein
VDIRNLHLLGKVQSLWIHSTCICCTLILVTIWTDIFPFLFSHIANL